MERILDRLWFGALALPEQFDSLPEAVGFCGVLLAESLAEAGLEGVTPSELRALERVARSYVMAAFCSLARPV